MGDLPSKGNPAVDNIAIGLRKEGVRAVRVGRPDKINRILEEITWLGPRFLKIPMKILLSCYSSVPAYTYCK